MAVNALSPPVACEMLVYERRADVGFMADLSVERGCCLAEQPAGAHSGLGSSRARRYLHDSNIGAAHAQFSGF